MTIRIVVLCALALLAGCTLGDKRKQFAESSVSLRYPDGWHVSGFSRTNSPRRLAIASYPLPDDAVEGDCGGSRAVELLPREGALVLVIDYGSRASFEPRAADVRLEGGRHAEYECFGPSTMFRFRVGDRDFQAHVALGPEADDALRDEALAILESIAVEEPERFVPETRREDEHLVMPLTFPDGTTAELTYPAELGLERFTVHPYSSGKLSNAVARDFFVVEGDVRDVLARMNDDAAPALLAVYEDARGGKVGLWDVGAGTNVNYLGFQFGRWCLTRLVRIHVSGPPPFVSALIRALAARDVALAGSDPALPCYRKRAI
jgi:hypothetical protein